MRVCGRDVPLFRRFSESLLRYGGKCCIICKEHPFAGQIFGCLPLGVLLYGCLSGLLHGGEGTAAFGRCLPAGPLPQGMDSVTFQAESAFFCRNGGMLHFLILWDGDGSEILRNPVWKCCLLSAAQLCFFTDCLAGAAFRRHSCGLSLLICLPAETRWRPGGYLPGRRSMPDRCRRTALRS